jgi:putative peptidoglycan lipid II flippase
VAPTRLAVWSIAVNIGMSLALYRSMGIGGVVLGTTISNVVLCVLEARVLRRGLGGLELARTLKAMAVMAAASVLLGGIAYGAWHGLDGLLGRSLPAQLVSVGVALGLGGLAYAAVMLRSGMPEAREISNLLARRLRPRAS